MTKLKVVGTSRFLADRAESWSTLHMFLGINRFCILEVFVAKGLLLPSITPHRSVLEAYYIRVRAFIRSRTLVRTIIDAKRPEKDND